MEKYLPKHVAIIMDGNGRWAKQHNHPRVFGHREGMKAIKDTVSATLKKGIPFLSLFAFSTENWNRPKSEIKFLLKLLDNALSNKLITDLNKRHITFHWVGFKENLPAKLVTKINKVEHDTAHNQHKLTLNICFNYGGMQDILQAAKLVKKQTTLAQFEKMLLTKNTPAVDLLIRTGNEKRISNFLLFQSAYAEIIFESTFWPQYNHISYYNNIQEYTQRQRRYGGIKNE